MTCEQAQCTQTHQIRVASCLTHSLAAGSPKPSCLDFVNRRVAVDNNYIPVSSSNSVVDVTHETSTVAITNAFGNFNITSVPASTTYAAVLRMAPASDLGDSKTEKPVEQVCTRD